MKIEINVKLGIAFGLITCIVWYSVAKSLGFYSLDIYSYKFYTTLLLLFTGVFLSIFLTRKSQQGFIDFKQALKTGFLFALVMSAILCAFTYLYHKFIVPDAVDFFVSEERKAWLAHDRKLEEVNQYLVEYYIPTFGAFHTLMTSVVWGILISLLASAIFRRKNPAISDSEN